VSKSNLRHERKIRYSEYYHKNFVCRLGIGPKQFDKLKTEPVPNPSRIIDITDGRQQTVIVLLAPSQDRTKPGQTPWRLDCLSVHFVCMQLTGLPLQCFLGYSGHSAQPLQLWPLNLEM